MEQPAFINRIFGLSLNNIFYVTSPFLLLFRITWVYHSEVSNNYRIATVEYFTPGCSYQYCYNITISMYLTSLGYCLYSYIYMNLHIGKLWILLQIFVKVMYRIIWVIYIYSFFFCFFSLFYYMVLLANSFIFYSLYVFYIKISFF